MELLLNSGGVSPLVLFAIGIIFIVLESLFFSFVLLWVGIACFIVSGISFVYVDIDLKWQISLISILSLILLLLLRTKSSKLFLKSKEIEHQDNFLNQSGYGVIKDSKVYFKATYWEIDPSDSNEYKNGQKVFIKKTKKNIAYM